MIPEEAVRQYLNRFDNAQVLISLEDRDRFQSQPRQPIFRNLEITDSHNNLGTITVGSSVMFIVDMYDFADLKNLSCGIIITDERARRVVLFQTIYHSGLRFDGADHVRLVCEIPSLPLVPGTYLVDLALGDDMQIFERIEQAGRFEVVFSDLFSTGRLPNNQQGYFALPCDWRIVVDV
jgi:hypothetical protein